MKYLVLKGCVINGARANAGDVVEVPDVEIKPLLGINRISPIAEQVFKTEDRAVGLDEETKPKRRGRPRKVNNDG